MKGHPGWTVVELLVVMALVGLVAALGSSFWIGARAHVDEAEHLARRIVVVRWEAMVSGRGAACLPGDLAGGPRSEVRVTWPVRGLAFTPDGLPRTCDGGGVGNTTILLEHRGRQAAVIVSSLGRVRWELR
ncbi:MAG: type II secretion system protein [Trueperaceae bacterium]